MATIIDAGDGRYIAGDPPTELPAGAHWCLWCRGDGLEWSDDTTTVCAGCAGIGFYDCTDTDCTTHRPAGRRPTPSWITVYAQIELQALAAKLTNARDLVATLRDLNRYDDRLYIAYARRDALEHGVLALASVARALREEVAA